MNAAEIENEFNRVKSQCPIVHAMMHRGCSLEEVIIELHKENNRIWEIVGQLTLIAPKKYVTPEGNVYFWQCPFDLVPVTAL